MAKGLISKQATDAQGMAVMLKSGKPDPKTLSGKHSRHNPRLNGGGSHHVAEDGLCWSVCNSTGDRDVCEFLHPLKHNLLPEKHIHFCFFITPFPFHY